MLTAVTGINWGDEGKGRVIDLLAENADVVVRYQGGNNAGHTVVTDNCKFVLNLLPSGILHPDVTCVLGDGMVVDLDHLENEIESIREKGIVISPQNLKLSKHATISMPWHKIQDELEEDRLAKTGSAFGSTRRGIAYAYSDKYKKKTLRLGDLLHLDKPHIQSRLKTMLEYKNLELGGCYHQAPMSYPALLSWCEKKAEQFAPYITDTGNYIAAALSNHQKVVLEAQLGAMRDIDYGIFPYTSSSSTISAYGPISPDELKVPAYTIEDTLKPYNSEYYEVSSLEETLPKLDVLYMTRVQKERFFSEDEYLRLKDTYILNREKLNLAKPDMPVLHPLPRVDEISTDVDDDNRAAYFKQVQNGKYVRMAVIMALLEITDPLTGQKVL